MRNSLWTRFVVFTTLTAFIAAPVRAASVDLANSPLISGLSKQVSPNLYFVLDDSGSMGYEYMPDAAGNYAGSLCYSNFGLNTIYFNPSATYVAPIKADGTSYPNSSYTAAKDDGFNAVSSTVDLSHVTTSTSSQNVTLSNNTLASVNSSYTITVTLNNHGFSVGDVVDFTSFSNSSGNNINLKNGTYTVTAVTTNTFTITAGTLASKTTAFGSSLKITVTHTTNAPDYYYAEYNAAPTAPPSSCQADSAYTKKAPSTAADQTNFANWYSYYRSRANLAKSSIGRSFAQLDSSYRVGFSTISETGTGTGFLNINTFDATQKTNWYAKLYAVSPSGWTPLRGALSKAGRLYSGTLSGATGANDPVQYSCQQNYTIMTTDGYWNTPSETSSYGPYKENNSTSVGDQDGVTGTARPYLDSGKYANSLSDIAMYYYKTDLRPTGSIGGTTPYGRLDVSTNNVPTSSGDTASWQHMVFYGVSFGAGGVLNYSENYLTGGNADYNAILQGTKNWPDPQTGCTTNCDTVTSRIDDLWHAAVNGHGQFLTVTDPASTYSAINKMLNSIAKTTSSSAAAATSSLEPTAGDNYAYTAQFTTALWSGDLQARNIDLVSGVISGTPIWSARDLLNAQVSASSDNRTIYTFSSGASNKLKAFTSANLSTEIAAKYFKSDSTNPNGALSQFSSWSTTDAGNATDAAMIGYIRGQTGYEDQGGNSSRLFRDRIYPLGDIVDSSPVFVKKPPFDYADAGYASFSAAQANRSGAVYVGANDGMLHAFDAVTGAELWTYIPTALIPYLYKLADTSYPTNHRFYVDGTPTVGDVWDGTKWITMLVGGLGAGGKGYYALDVTDPANPKALWEFTSTQDADLGYAYGNPVITKRASDGKWVVLFASGYNNTSGDSKARLFALDAASGTKLSEIIADNTVTDPNVDGMAKIVNYVANTLTDNSTQYVYGGDLGGSLWRFDINAGTSQKLGSTSATLGNQPITVRPEVARIRDGSGNYQRVVYFATGRYLGFTDIQGTSTSSTVAQAVYAIKDTGANLGVFTNSAANLVMQTLNTSGNPRTVPNPLPVDWAAKNGWYVPLPVGERVTVDPKLQVGTLAVVANALSSDYCSVGGTSWLYSFDFGTGGAVSSAVNKSVGTLVGSALAAGLALVRLPNSKLVAIVTESDASLPVLQVGTAPAGGGTLRRVSWREVF